MTREEWNAQKAIMDRVYNLCDAISDRSAADCTRIMRELDRLTASLPPGEFKTTTELANAESRKALTDAGLILRLSAVPTK